MKKYFLLLVLASFTLMGWAQTTWYDPMGGDKAYLCGRGWNDEIGTSSYHRFPDRMKALVRPVVWNLSCQTAGMSIRFVTDSKHITVHYLLTSMSTSLPNVTALNKSGVDLYVTDVHGNTTWCPNGMKYSFNWNKSDTTEFRYDLTYLKPFGKRGQLYELFLPTYNGVKWMNIGVDEGSKFQFVAEDKERPIVLYGTSIAQGASASRPGMIWSTLLKRHYEMPVINLGFSGNAHMESVIFDAMSEIDARVYILDCIPNNAGGGEEFANKVRYGVKKLREKSNAPILFMEDSGVTDGTTLDLIRFNRHHMCDSVQRKVYDELVAQGVKDLYYISNKEVGMTADDFIEGVHPNDLGMKKYADAYIRVLDKILIGDNQMRDFKPLKQRRDNSYEWLDRHNEIIARNRTKNPEILMIGNSITHYWGGEPVSERNWGGDCWQKLFGNRVVTNMGMGWDCVENVYWRLMHGEIDDCKPQKIFLMIGTNNWADSNEKIVSGICDIAQLIRKKQPQAQLYVVKIYPKKNSEPRVKEVNDLLERTLKCDAKTTLVDMTKYLTLKDGSGKVDASCFREGLHPNEKGYAALHDAYSKLILK